MGGECRAFISADYQILGKTRFDQAWIDQIIESGVAACGWPRPADRPKNWDEVREYARVVAATPPKQKPGLIQRIKERFKRKPVVERRIERPVAVMPAPRPVEAPPPEVAPVRYLDPSPLMAPPPNARARERSAIDELLTIEK